MQVRVALGPKFRSRRLVFPYFQIGVIGRLGLDYDTKLTLVQEGRVVLVQSKGERTLAVSDVGDRS